MIIIGLTGGVASGKSFVAEYLTKLKIPVFDADLEVHKLLADDKEIIAQIKQNFPKAIANNKVDRALLGAEVLRSKDKLNLLENIIYPALRKVEDQFIKNCGRNHCKLAVLNIPLLFEKGGYKRCDKTIAVIVSEAIQFSRFRNRLRKQNGKQDKNLSNDLIRQKFFQITNNQIDNKERKIKADYIINNGLSRAFTVRQIKDILKHF